MDISGLQDAIAMALTRQHVWISTADSLGVPHIASVGSVRVEDDRVIVLSDWACPTTLMNLKSNNSITIVAWDVMTDRGYQILGRVADVAALVSDGDEELGKAIVGDRELWVRPHRVFAFSHAPHDDAEAIPLGTTQRGAGHAVSSVASQA
jgi:hypothetical protein